MKRIMAFLLSIMIVAGSVFSTPAVTKAYQVPSNLKWWANDRFGMFIHLGAYSSYGKGEWIMNVDKISKKKYQEEIASKFNPKNFNAKEIVSYAKKAGMKYIVITAKHHEGLALWDTKVESFKDYTGTKTFSLQQYTPFGASGRDILMELKNACKKAGIHFGLYYSILDWNHSSQTISGDFTKMRSMEARKAYIQDMKAQLKELMTTYDPEIMWFDGDWTLRKSNPTLEKWWTKADGKDLYRYLKSIKSSVIVNERVCRNFGLGDFECPEQTVPAADLTRPWETCQTMNNSWGYTKANEKWYRSSKSIVRELVDVVSKNGNYLLNIGPKGDGSMTPKSKTVLNGVAKWMKKNSESIYGAVKSPFKKTPSWGKYTRKGKMVYVHVNKWPKNGKLAVTRYKKYKVKKVTCISNGKKYKYSTKGKTVKLKVGKKAVNTVDTVFAIQYQ